MRKEVHGHVTPGGEVGMTDLEKIIKGLKKCRRCECDDCAEKGASQAPWDCPAYDDFVDSAIALLKEQEPVPNGNRIKAGDVVLSFYECGYCKNAIRKPWRYCPFCGQAVKWNV